MDDETIRVWFIPKERDQLAPGKFYRMKEFSEPEKAAKFICDMQPKCDAIMATRGLVKVTTVTTLT